MPTITFHVLTSTAPDAHLRHACRLAEQAVDQGKRVFVRIADTDAQRIDDLLWTFGDHSFLPHELVTPQSPSHPHIRVLIGELPAPTDFRDVVINLSHDALADTAIAQTIIELVPTDPERKRQARERFKSYRDRGMEPATQNV